MTTEAKADRAGEGAKKRARVSAQAMLPAKLTRPRLAAVYCRMRLIEALDLAFYASSVWIEAPPGAGKTTLAASWLDAHKLSCMWYQMDSGDADPATFFHYLGLAAKHIAPRYKRPLPSLTPEYLPGIEIFSRRYFEEMFRRMPANSLFVLDNVQEAGAGLNHILRIAIECLPSHVKMLFLSRASPPPEFARLRANGQLAVLEHASISLTPEEAQGMAVLRGENDAAKVKEIYRRTQGWMAGLVLMLDDPGMRMPGTHDPQTLFNYFATEVLRGFDEAVRQFLMKSALLPKMRVHDVESLTGYGEGGRVLAALQRRSYFTYRLQPSDPVYEFHPLFREFLLERLQETSGADELNRLRSEAARLLDVAGETEEAAYLWSMAQDWEVLVAHIAKHTPRLLGEGRAHVAKSWLAALPGELVNAAPWLQYWLGACCLAFNPVQARIHFEAAFKLFEEAGDTVGQYQSWASIVDTFDFEWGDFKPLDRWIAVMDGLIAGHEEFPSPEIEMRVAAGMLSALFGRQPWRGDLSLWAEQVEHAVLMSDSVPSRMKLANNLIFYYLWSGDLAKISVLVKELRPAHGIDKYDPLTRQMWFVLEAMYSWYAADWATCKRAIVDGLKNADNSGVHMLDFYLLAQGVYGGLSLGDPSAAADYLEKMSRIDSPRLGDKALYHYHVSSLAWCRGDFAGAAEHGRQAVKITEEMGWLISLGLCLIELAATLFDGGWHDEADACLTRAIDTCRGMVMQNFLICMHGARFAFGHNQEAQGREFLKRGLAMGKRHGFVNMPRWNNQTMAVLLAKALELGIETDYVRNLIRKRELDPPQEARASESWPWLLKIRTLGSFSFARDGAPVLLEGKVQRKPLELLKALIAFGTAGVSEQKICDALWPDAEADDARRNFKITLHRLRSLIGHEAVVLRESKLLLDSCYCWVDAHAMEPMLDRIVSASASMPIAELQHLGAQIMALYRGAFLAADEAVFAITPRERLRAKLMHAITALTERLQREGQTGQIFAWFEKGIEIEPLAESFYQGIMRACLALQRPAEGLAVYERCRKTLVAQLQINPTPETEALAKALKVAGSGDRADH
jgi:ATP/maltotriose-dependent transcriptional regulator MalT/DNA-binding SARP family transcriptional activator